MSDNERAKQEEKRAEVDKNYEAFLKVVDDYLPLHANHFALMRGGEIIQVYKTWEDAYATGQRSYEDGLFSVQKITKTPTDLGYFSYAVPI